MVACAVALTYLVASAPSEENSLGSRVGSLLGDEDLAAKAREEAMAQARQFTLRLHTYGPQDLDAENKMPEYSERVSELMTDKLAADFETNVTYAEQAVSQAGAGRLGEVFATGVSSIDADSATVLVAGAFTNSYPNPENAEQRIDADSLPFRYEVTVLKVGGEWLVDKFVPVTGEEEELQP
jgi:Mce-associated membrane protein